MPSADRPEQTSCLGTPASQAAGEREPTRVQHVAIFWCPKHGPVTRESTLVGDVIDEKTGQWLSGVRYCNVAESFASCEWAPCEQLVGERPLSLATVNRPE